MAFMLSLVLICVLVIIYTGVQQVPGQSNTPAPSKKVSVQLRKRSGGGRIPRIRPLSQEKLSALLKRPECLLVIDLNPHQRTEMPCLSGIEVISSDAEKMPLLMSWVPANTNVLLVGLPDSGRIRDRGAQQDSPIYIVEHNGGRQSFAHHVRLVASLVGFMICISPAIAQYRPNALVSEDIDSVGTSSSLALEGGNTLTAEHQSSGSYGNGGYKQNSDLGQSWVSHLAIEGGAGFDTPLGNTSKRQSEGLNVKLGGGWNFNSRFGVLAEYEFNRSGVPSAELTAVGAPSGNVHLWGITLDPIYYLKNNGGWGGYVTGGYGFYRRLTSFTQPINLGYGCDFYGYCYPQYGNQTLSHFSSNQGGGSIGGGVTRGFGSSRAKLYVEARYLRVATPKSSSAQAGSGSISMIPVTFGIRF